MVVRLAGLYPVPIRPCSARSARPPITNKWFKHLPYPSCGYYVKSFTLTLYTPTSFNHDLFDFIRICSGENLPLLQPALWISHNGFWESFRLWDSSCHHSYLQMVHVIFSRRSKCGENFSFSVFEHTLHRIQIRPWGKYGREFYSYFSTNEPRCSEGLDTQTACTLRLWRVLAISRAQKFWRATYSNWAAPSSVTSVQGLQIEGSRVPRDDWVW